MGDLGTGLVRRWLMWTAVTLATVAKGVGSGRLARGYHRAVVFGSLLLIVLLGVVSTLDVLDVWNMLPWMGERTLAVEVGYGALAAVLLPAALSVAWGAFWRAGVIAGVALALLLHVTLVLLVLMSLFQVMELLTRGRRRPRAATKPLPGTP